MKSLHTYTREAQNELYKKTGSFFAFNDQQFNEQKKEGVTYVSLGGGLFTEKGMEKIFQDGMTETVKNGIQQDIEENGKEAIILRELNNYECFYTGNYKDALDLLEDYGFTRREVETVFYAH